MYIHFSHYLETKSRESEEAGPKRETTPVKRSGENNLYSGCLSVLTRVDPEIA